MAGTEIPGETALVTFDRKDSLMEVSMKARLRVVLAPFLLSLMSHPAYAEDALEILKSVEQRYRSAQTGEIVTEYRPAQGRALRTRLLWLEEKWRVENDTTDLVSLHLNDGIIQWQYHAGKNQYIGHPVLEASGPLSQYRRIVRDGTEYVLARSESIQANSRQIPCFVVTATRAPDRGDVQRRQTYWIDANDRVIWRVRVDRIQPSEDKQQQLLYETNTKSVELDSRADENLYVFRPPPYALRVEQFRKEGDPPQESTLR